MSRPKPNILLEYVDKKSYKSEQILEADAIWAVFYEGKPFNLKTQNILTSYPGHAINLSKKLNETFNCIKFSVVKLITGEEVKES